MWLWAEANATQLVHNVSLRWRLVFSLFLTFFSFSFCWQEQLLQTLCKAYSKLVIKTLFSNSNFTFYVFHARSRFFTSCLAKTQGDLKQRKKWEEEEEEARSSQKMVACKWRMKFLKVKVLLVWVVSGLKSFATKLMWWMLPKMLRNIQLSNYYQLFLLRRFLSFNLPRMNLW